MLGVTNLHRELTGSNTTNYELDVNRAFTTAATESEERNILSILQVIERKENPFVNPPKEKRLHNIQTKEVMTDDIRIQLLDVEGIGLTAYEKLREERFCTKSVRLSDVIHRTNLKSLYQKLSFFAKSELTVLKRDNFQFMLYLPFQLKACLIHINMFVYVCSNV